MENLPTHFISHSEEDGLLSVFVQNLIEEHITGVTVASPVKTFNTASGSVAVGDQFKEIILTAINQSSFIIFIITEKFFDSAYCVSELGVSWSFEHEKDKQMKTIIPLFFDSIGEERFLKSPLSHIQGMTIKSIEDIHRFIKYLKGFSDNTIGTDKDSEKLIRESSIDERSNSSSRKAIQSKIKTIFKENQYTDEQLEKMCIKYGRNFSEGNSKYNGWFTIRIPEKIFEEKEYIIFCLIIDENDSTTWKFLIIPKNDFNSILKTKSPDKNHFYHFYISYQDDKNVEDNRDTITNLSKYLMKNNENH